MLSWLTLKARHQVANKISQIYLILPHCICLHSNFHTADYQEHNKWQELRSKLEPVIADLRDVQGLTYSLVKRLEAHGLFIENVRGRTDNQTVIYAITPTFARPVQKAELTRLAQTFLHVRNFHWILVEDAPQKTALVSRFLEISGLIYTHLAATTPPNYKLGRNDPNWKKPRGVEQRNAALRWLRENLRPSNKGVVFFADDDNTYSVKLFHEVKRTASEVNLLER